MFERQYVLVSFDWADRAVMTEQINAAVRECDQDRASASIFCISHDKDQLHVLIEKWRIGGDAEQDTQGSVDRSSAPRKSRRARTGENDDTGAAARVEPESVELPLEQATVTD